MSLKGKIITFIIPLLPWSPGERGQVGEEIVELKEKGGEVFPFLLVGEGESSFPGVEERAGGLKGLVMEKEEALSSKLLYQADLVLVAPCPGSLLEELARREFPPPGLPLIVAPHSYQEEGKEAMAGLRKLFKRDLTYFVPFQPLRRRNKGEAAGTFFRSRLDLIGETAEGATREGQVQPVVLELESFPG
ncbi:MAG: hypothetical protein D5R97_05065 [Candidatus Syntrophonatronum acetioxidans]|uniref:Uncharacterized protein n=1 Tax=Candidatus Syntrophonatronum acetioxidans TaxID=1795816 RepID=A0A424YEV4_9FIRM|nr:MAG: hypothetical protein D5R97_05065 [Candidatus Syntrophonatronum acetioxidans]